MLQMLKWMTIIVITRLDRLGYVKLQPRVIISNHLFLEVMPSSMRGLSQVKLYNVLNKIQFHMANSGFLYDLLQMK